MIDQDTINEVALRFVNLALRHVGDALRLVNQANPDGVLFGMAVDLYRWMIRPLPTDPRVVDAIRRICKQRAFL